MSSRFDYIAYDDISQGHSESARNFCQGVEATLANLHDSREKSLALTKLEECFMWIGKAIRNDQVKRQEQAGT